MGIFDGSDKIRPYTYPQLEPYPKAIHRAFWEVDHFTYDRDVRDFNIELSEFEKQVVERAMLSIGVVENKVKTFWALIGERMPFTEVSDAGQTFAGNEVIHRLAYERLLTLLGLQERFEEVLEVDCMRGRSNYLKKYLKGINSRSDKEFTKSLILFTLLIENTSLFSQFLIVSSFSKYKNLMKNFGTVITATTKEEALHGKFGAELVNIIRKENPDWFDDEMEQKIRRNVRKAYRAEVEVLEWIFEGGELEHISKQEVQEYLKFRFNDGLNQIGYENEYDVDEKLLEKSDYMETVLLSTKNFDFFDTKGTDYSVDKSFTEDNLWN